MAQTARARTAPFLPDVLIREILLRLPAKALLRCRVVCRSWKKLISAKDFFLDHHRHQPSLPLVWFHGQTPKCSRDVVNGALDAFDLRRSPVERRPVLRFNNYRDSHSYRFHASCDGLLVVSLCRNRFYYICNPTTRQWISLPSLTRNDVDVLGLYQHSPSDEYRILYRNGRKYNDGTCFVLTVGTMAPRGVGKYRSSGLCYVREGPSVLLHGYLHWVHYEMEKVLIFDTVGESFRRMSVPTDDNSCSESHLVQINGTLGISRINRSRTVMKLWMLQNYEAEVWLMKYQIEFPVAEMRSIANILYLHGMVLSENGDVLVYGNQNSNYLFHCDSTGKLLQKFRWDGVFPWPTIEWFKESLVQHPFFDRKDGRRARKPRARKPRFFQGL